MKKNVKSATLLITSCVALFSVVLSFGFLSVRAEAAQVPANLTAIKNQTDENGFEISFPSAKIDGEDVEIDVRTVLPSLVIPNVDGSFIANIDTARKLAAAQKAALASGYALELHGIDGNQVTVSLCGVSDAVVLESGVTVPETVLRYVMPSEISTAAVNANAETNAAARVLAGFMTSAGFEADDGAWFLFNA